MKLKEPPKALEAYDFDTLIKIMANHRDLSDHWRTKAFRRYNVHIGENTIYGRFNAMWYELWSNGWRVKCRIDNPHTDGSRWIPVAFGGDLQRCETDLMLLKMLQ